jgi:hypothetical protein
LRLGAPNFVNEFFEPSVIFLAGLRFDTASDVDAVGPHETNGFRDVFDLETAGKNDTTRGGGAAGEVPIGGLAGAPILACTGSVEEKGEDVGVAVEHRKSEIGIDAKARRELMSAGLALTKTPTASISAGSLERICAASAVEMRRRLFS